MAQRISRAKAKIRDARIPYRIPSSADLPARLQSVLAVLYLVFSEGYAASSRSTAGPRRAVRRGDAARASPPDAAAGRGGGRGPPGAAAAGGCAPCRAHGCRRAASSRFPSRTARLWDAATIAEGHALVRDCLRRGRPGPYQLQAAIQAVHDDAPTADGHRLAADRGALRPAAAGRPHSDRRPQPRGRRRRGGRAGGRARGDRAAAGAAGALLPAARHPGASCSRRLGRSRGGRGRVRVRGLRCAPATRSATSCCADATR